MPKKKQQTQQSEPEETSDDEKAKLDLNRPKIDRILKDGANMKRIVINVSMTQYPVVSEVAQELGWKIQTDPEAGDWDVFWTDYSIEPDILIRMHFHQKINHYPGIYLIARKNLLGMNLMTLRNKFPQQYNFFPLTWMLPSQYAQFRMYYETVPKGKVRTYIVKPEAECQGRGIFLTRNIEQIQNGKHYVIQKYVNKPYLIDGLKFDLRIYVLIAGTTPLRLYLFEQGLARFATEPYVEPNSTNLDQTYVHLTNYAINKNNPKFVFNKSVNDMSVGHKRSLTSVYKLLEKKGENVPLLKQKIKDIIIKTLLTSNPLMSHQYQYSQPEQYSGNMCFHILGIDVLITETFDPLLLEVNHTPSFTTDTPLDTMIKHNLIKETLILMNINVKTKQSLYKKAKVYNKERLLTGKRQIFQGEVKQKQIQVAQLERDEYENDHIGSFERIHPTRNEQRQKAYDQILQFATKMYHQQNTLRARIEEREARKMLKEQRRMYKQKKEIKEQEKTTENKIQVEKIKQERSEHKTTQVRCKQPRVNNSQALIQKPISREHRLSKDVEKPKPIKNGAGKLRPSIHQKPSKSKLRSRLYGKLQYPHVPLQQKQNQLNQLLLSESDLIERKQQLEKTVPTANYSTNPKKSIQQQLQIKAIEQRSKLQKLRKMQEQAQIFNKANNKLGNFIMPKIFQLGVQHNERQSFQQILKINLKYDQ